MTKTQFHFVKGALQLEDAYQCLEKNTNLRASTIVIGNVDTINQEKKVKGIAYQIHHPLAEIITNKLMQDTTALFSDISALYFSHAYDFVPAGKICTLLGLSANNWSVVNNAANFFITEMKRRLPIWKHEHYIDEQSQWLPGQHVLQDTLC